MSFLLALHSLVRWLLLAALLYSVYRAYTGFKKGGSFGRLDNLLRHNTATIAHIQLIIGFVVYFKSPIISNFYSSFSTSVQQMEMLFFGLLHISLMLLAIILVTIGSALAKRRKTDVEKFKTMFSWFLVALIIIFLAIPWPFSPLASRPYIKPF
ncbi:MAG: hypothetical protein JNL60_11140 [Bacteroidia bacterium]|nr:hypothetical protein [Bacteroidia bacterium]